jgi:tetratricopeptide (TPR) repeat protein
MSSLLLTPLLAVIGMVGFAFYSADPNAISVDPINSSGWVSYNGYGSKTLSVMFTSQLMAIEAASATSRGAKYQSEDKVRDRAIEAMSDSLQIAKPIKVIQMTLGLIPLQVGGSVVESGREIQLMLTAYGADGRVFKVKKAIPDTGSVDTLMKDGAVALLEQVDLYQIANYWFKTERKSKEFTNARRLVRDGILRGDRKDLPWFYNLSGRILDTEGKYEEAIVQYQQALAVDPSFARSHLHWARALVGLKRYDEAQTHLAKALELDPGYADVHVERAAVFIGQGEPIRAMQAYADALALDEHHAYAYYKWSELLLQRGRIGDAVEALRRAVYLEPKNKDYQAALDNALAAGDSVFKGLSQAVKQASAK